MMTVTRTVRRKIRRKMEEGEVEVKHKDDDNNDMRDNSNYDASNDDNTTTIMMPVCMFSARSPLALLRHTFPCVSPSIHCMWIIWHQRIGQSKVTWLITMAIVNWSPMHLSNDINWLLLWCHINPCNTISPSLYSSSVIHVYIWDIFQWNKWFKFEFYFQAMAWINPG